MPDLPYYNRNIFKYLFMPRSGKTKLKKIKGREDNKGKTEKDDNMEKDLDSYRKRKTQRGKERTSQ